MVYLLQYEYRICQPSQPNDRCGCRSIPTCVEALEADSAGCAILQPGVILNRQAAGQYYGILDHYEVQGALKLT